MSTVRKLQPSFIPYYVFLQQAAPTKTIRQLAGCYLTYARKPLNRYECLGEIHRRNLIDSIAKTIGDNEDLELYSKGRIIFFFSQEANPKEFVDLLLENMLPRKEPALTQIDESRLEFEVNRGKHIDRLAVGDGAALEVYERAFLYTYKNSRLWLLPLTTYDSPFVKVGGRQWIPLLLAAGSLRSMHLGITIKDALNFKSTSIRFTSYQPAGIALMDVNSDIVGVEIRLYGPSTITRRVKTFVATFASAIRYLARKNKRNITVLTGYDLANSIGPNRIARILYDQVKQRSGIAVMLRLRGMRYSIVTYGDLIGLDRKVSAEEVAANLLNYSSPEEFFSSIESKGEPQIMFFSLRLPKRLELDLLLKGLPDEARPSAIVSATYNYIGINTVNLSMYTYSSMTENGIREEIHNLLVTPLRQAIEQTLTQPEYATTAT